VTDLLSTALPGHAAPVFLDVQPGPLDGGCPV
jgi:hypothetical protein